MCNRGNEMKHTFNIDRHEIRNMCLKLEDFYLEKGIKDDDVQDLVLATDEALTNIKLHGYKETPGEVTLETSVLDSTVVIKIEDSAGPYIMEDAKGFNKDSYIQSGVNGGFGLLLINRLMSSVNLERADDKNHLSMSKEVEFKNPA